MKLIALKKFDFGNLKCYAGDIFEYDSKAICAILIYRKYAEAYNIECNEKIKKPRRKKKAENENTTTEE